MPSFKNLLKKAFQSVAPRDLGTKEYDFANEGKTVHITTNKGWFTTSYTMTYSDGQGLSGANTEKALLQDVRAKGINKAKNFCGITG